MNEIEAELLEEKDERSMEDTEMQGSNLSNMTHFRERGKRNWGAKDLGNGQGMERVRDNREDLGLGRVVLCTGRVSYKVEDLERPLQYTYIRLKGGTVRSILKRHGVKSLRNWTENIGYLIYVQLL